MSHNNKPMVCSGSVIRFRSDSSFFGRSAFSMQVDQTPVQVKEAFDGANGLVELTFQGVAVYVLASETITTITPVFEEAESSEDT